MLRFIFREHKIAAAGMNNEDDRNRIAILEVRHSKILEDIKQREEEQTSSTSKKTTTEVSAPPPIPEVAVSYAQVLKEFL